MKNIFNWRFFPIELLTLAPISLILFFVLILSSIARRINIIKLAGDFINLASVLGGHKLFTAFTLLWFIYILALFLSCRLNLDNLNRARAAVSLLYLTIVSSLTSIILGMCTEIIFYLSEAADAVKSTLILDSLEKGLFGNLPALSLIKACSGLFLEPLFIYSYAFMYIIFSLAIFFLALKDKKIFRVTLIAFFVAFIISLPIWLFFPAVSPDGLYVAKIFSGDFKITDINFHPSDFLAEMIPYFQKIWISQDGQFISVSSLPSMHIAWASIALIGLSLAKKGVPWLFSLWFLLNFVGAFYSLQHYFLDLIAGAVVGAIAYLIANKLVAIEKKYYLGGDFYYICDFLAECEKAGKKLLTKNT